MRSSDTTYIRSRDGVDARFFDITKMVKNCQNDSRWPFDLHFGLIWTAKKNWTKYFFNFRKFIIFVEIERKTISTVVMLHISHKSINYRKFILHFSNRLLWVSSVITRPVSYYLFRLNCLLRLSYWNTFSVSYFWHFDILIKHHSRWTTFS